MKGLIIVGDVQGKRKTANIYISDLLIKTIKPA